MQLKFTSEGYLFPIGKITTDISNFEQVFVNAFPTSTTRPRLWANYLQYIQRFRQEVSNNFVQWLDGSFVTLKENPNDIDMVTFINYHLYESMDAKQQLEHFWSYNLEYKGLDSYLMGVYPESHRNYLKYQKYCEDWHTRYCNTKQNKEVLYHVKGFIELRFE
ncbi:MAG: hypothetical protein HC912_03720 [Saprospiraceae bacterium]|nr:hypothetical protein [Saprospiraceae bacterium]